MEGPGAQGEAGLNDTKVTSNFPVLRSQFTSFPQGPWPGGSGSPSPIFRDWKCLGQPAYYLAHKFPVCSNCRMEWRVSVPSCTLSPMAQLETYSTGLMTFIPPSSLAASACRLGIQCPKQSALPGSSSSEWPIIRTTQDPIGLQRPPSWALSLQILTPHGLGRAQESVFLKTTPIGVLMVRIWPLLGITCGVILWQADRLSPTDCWVRICNIEPTV